MNLKFLGTYVVSGEESPYFNLRIGLNSGAGFKKGEKIVQFKRDDGAIVLIKAEDAMNYVSE